MIDTGKIKLLKRALGALALILVFCLGLGFGQMGNQSKTETTPKKDVTKTVKSKNRLTEKQVEQFLIAYYTKKDLEENRNRYKEYMTEGMYNAIVSEENKAQNQTYKGYVINFEFQSADIYIDQANKSVICEITYTNDLLQKKDNLEGAQTGVINRTAIKLDYIQADNTYLVNQMNSLIITDSANPSATQEVYGDVPPPRLED